MVLGDKKKGYLEMKYIIAIVKPSKLNTVRSSLINIGVHGLTTTEVSGFGRQKGHTEIYKGAEYNINFVPKIKIEVAVTDTQELLAIEAITDAAKTEKIGDGKIFVLDLSHAIRVRTGETNNHAL